MALKTHDVHGSETPSVKRGHERRICEEGTNTIPVSITSTHLRRVLRAMLSDRRNHNPACVLLGMSTLLPSSFSQSDALVRLAPHRYQSSGFPPCLDTTQAAG